MSTADYSQHESTSKLLFNLFIVVFVYAFWCKQIGCLSDGMEFFILMRRLFSSVTQGVGSAIKLIFSRNIICGIIVDREFLAQLTWSESQKFDSF